MLARGWLAYPVTTTHALLPPKSGCINVIPACARGALLLVTPSARRDSGGRMGHRRDTTSMRFGDALLPPLGAAHPHRKNRHHHPIAPMARCEKTAEERLYMLARGWLAYPVTPTHHTSTAEERLYKRHPGMRQRRITPRNPTRTTWRDTISMRFGDALLPPLGAMHRHREKNRHPSACLPRDALRHTQRAEPPFPGSPALRLNQLLFSYSITFCALPSTTTT